METTNEKIHQLLEMLDNPDAYTEQEIRDIINHDKEIKIHAKSTVLWLKQSAAVDIVKITSPSM